MHHVFFATDKEGREYFGLAQHNDPLGAEEKICAEHDAVVAVQSMLAATPEVIRFLMQLPSNMSQQEALYGVAGLLRLGALLQRKADAECRQQRETMSHGSGI